MNRRRATLCSGGQRSCSTSMYSSTRPLLHFVSSLAVTLNGTDRASSAIIVTVVYWALLGGSDSFSTTFSCMQMLLAFNDMTLIPHPAYSNITKHALNSFFCVFEVAFTNVGPLRWIDLPATILILAGYVGVAYITYHTQHFYRELHPLVSIIRHL